MLRSNERGLTLIETLAIIVIGAIFMVLAFNIISSGINNSKQIQERANIQNEANYLLVVLREFHERGNEYMITFNNGEMIIEDVNHHHYKTLFNSFLYKVNGKDTINNNTEFIEIDPKNEDKNFPIELILESKKYPQIKHSTKTVLQIL